MLGKRFWSALGGLIVAALEDEEAALSFSSKIRCE